MNGVLLGFGYWSNYNILVSSEGIIMLQKSLFSHDLSCNSSLVFVLIAVIFLI